MPSISLPVAVLGAGALGIGGGIASSIISSNAAGKAADAQTQAANTAANTQLGIFNQTQSNLAPYNQMGQSALSQLASLFGLGPGGSGGPSQQSAGAATSALTNYPGYQFGLGQGQQALDRSAASRGLLLSGAQLKDSQQFGQQYGLQQAWNPYVSQLNNFASLGENAAATTGNIGANTGASVANSQLAAGQATASGIVGSSNAINSGIGSGINSGLNSGLLAYALNNQSRNQTNNENYAADLAQSQNLGVTGVGQYS